MPSPRPPSPLNTGLGSGRLAVHHFSFLRALAEGLPALDAARRYLGAQGVAEAHAAHRAVVDQVQALARRRRQKHWRLVGIEVRAIPPSSTPSSAPALTDWAEQEGLEGWSEAELLELYQQRFGARDASAGRRAARNARMRAQRLQLLKDLEAAAAERPSPLDPLDGWLNPQIAHELQKLGDHTLADLRNRIARGGQWWRGLPAYGPTKAARLARHVELLLGAPANGAWPLATAQHRLSVLSGREGVNRAPAGSCATEARDDREALRAWISARAGSPHTAAQYEREAERFLLFCVIERRKALSDATAEDCRAYMDFLADVPSSWISRHKVARFAPGWAPFRGPLTLASQVVAIAAVNSLFEWLVRARYLVGNPWVLVNRKLGDDPRANDDPAGSRAFTPVVWAAIKVHLAQHPNTASAHRLTWLCLFVEATGLRAAELLRATRRDLRPSGSGWLIRVHGKGRKNRTVPVPSSALAATRHYFEARGMDFETADGTVPLLASLADPAVGISYRALAESFTRLVKRVMPDLPLEERRGAERASAHWLRHTHATRAAEREVPLDVLQENLGQSDSRTTARYYRAQIARRQTAMERAFGVRDEASLK